MRRDRLFLVVSSGFLAALLVALFVWIPGCLEGPDPMVPFGSGSGTLTIRMTDAPFPFDLVDSASVTIDSVSVHESSEDSTLSGFRVLSREEETFNLLDLQNGVTATLASADLPVGFVNQIRLFVSSARVVLTDARSFDLVVPSGEESGLKIHLHPAIEIVGSLSTEILLDFDVSRSFLPIPGGPDSSHIEGFHFRPSLRAINASAVGLLSGKVTNDAGTPDDSIDDTPIEGAAVTALLGGEVVTSTSTDENGEYLLVGLPAGSYLLEASATGFESDSREATVIEGNEIDGNDFALSPTLAP